MSPVQTWPMTCCVLMPTAVQEPVPMPGCNANTCCYARNAGVLWQDTYRQIGQSVATEHKPIQIGNGICVTHLTQLVSHVVTAALRGAAKSLPSRFREMRMTLLLLSSRVLRRGSLGKPSSLTMTLSERSRLSNWFCMRLHMVTDYSCKAFNTACCVALQCTAAVWTARTVYAGYVCLGKYLCGSQIFYGR